MNTYFFNFLGIQKEGHKVKFGFPQQSFCKPFLPHSGRPKGKQHPHLGQYDPDVLTVPGWYPETQHQFNNFYLQRNSAPNIHTAGSNSNFAALFKKRHSFQEGVRFFQDKVDYSFTIFLNYSFSDSFKDYECLCN